MLRDIQKLDCLLIKPAGADCNLKCKYCFYLEKQKLFANEIHRMSEEKLEALIKDALSGSSSHFSFIWQGGEPTLMGLDFFKKAVEFQHTYARNIRITNSLQTNATLLNEEWADFFYKNKFFLGISIDGPEHIHNIHRKNNSQKGTWEKVSQSIKLLQEKKVMFNVVSCVTEQSHSHVEEIYNYFKSIDCKFMQFIPVVELDEEGKNTDFSVSAKDYGEFLCKLFDLWVADFQNNKATTSIRYFDTLATQVVGYPAADCSAKKMCGVYLVAEHTADIYPCDFFVDNKYLLANLSQKSMHEIINSKQQREFGGCKANLNAKCKKCVWLKFCQGGCLKDRRNNTAAKNMNYFCKSMKVFLPYAVPLLKKLFVQK